MPLSRHPRCSGLRPCNLPDDHILGSFPFSESGAEYLDKGSYADCGGGYDRTVWQGTEERKGRQE